MTARSLDVPRHRWNVRLLAFALLTFGLALLVSANGSAAEHGPVHVLEITGEIDLGLAPFLDRALEEASQDGAAALIVVIDTPGGRLDAVLQMRDSLLTSPVRTVAYVDRNAFSAGALIALASEEIHMAPGAVMGAATPVDASGVQADEKVISAVRSTFEATAQERGRDPLVAEAMVDPAVEIEGLVARGSLLTLTVEEAIEVGYADGVPRDLPELLDELMLGDRELVRTAPSLAERVVRFITNPVIASLLITLGVLLFLGDLLSGGIGVGAGAGAALLATFFWGHLLAGLTGWEDVVLVVIGVGLILVEILVVPGFGVPGVLGLAAVLGGSFLATLNRDFDFVGTDQILRSGITVAAAFVAIVLGLIGFLSYLSRRGGPPGIVLRSQAGSTRPVTSQRPSGWLRWFGDGSVLASDRDDEPSVAAEQPREPGAGGRRRTVDPPDAAVQVVREPPGEPAGPRPTQARSAGRLTGALGVALSDLRPAGVAEIDGRRIDVVTEGEYIRSGETIEVMIDEGYRRVVRRRPPEEPLRS